MSDSVGLNAPGRQECFLCILNIGFWVTWLLLISVVTCLANIIKHNFWNQGQGLWEISLTRQISAGETVFLVHLLNFLFYYDLMGTRHCRQGVYHSQCSIKIQGQRFLCVRVWVKVSVQKNLCACIYTWSHFHVNALDCICEHIHNAGQLVCKLQQNCYPVKAWRTEVQALGAACQAKCYCFCLLACLFPSQTTCFQKPPHIYFWQK